MTLDDPFSICYDSIWKCVEGNEHITALVRLKNRIKLQDNIDPIKRTVQDADLPELMLFPDGGSISLRATSSGTKCIKRYSWMVTTGQTLVTERILPVEFALIRAMAHWPTTIGQATWNGKTFVKRVDMGDIIEGESDPERNRGIKGWSALMTIEIEMVFQTGDL